MLYQFRKIIEFICKPAEVIFKIVEIIADPLTKRNKIRYQAIGKSLTTVESAERLFGSLAKIQGFPEKDSQYIIECYQYEKDLPDFVIIEIKFNKDHIILRMREAISGWKFELTLEYFKENCDILNHFSVDDIKKILYMLFEKSFNKEKQLIKNDKRNNNKNILRLTKP